MNLYHYSEQPFVFDRNHDYQQKVDGMKPAGLWFSIEDDWPRWCIAEDFNTKGLTYCTEIVLIPDANILHLSTPRQIDEFTKVFRNNGSDWIRYIDWSRLSEQYQGLLIAPYIWERRLTPHTLWYYGWDCASGCIWDLSAVGRTENVICQTTPSGFNESKI